MAEDSNSSAANSNISLEDGGDSSSSQQQQQQQQLPMRHLQFDSRFQNTNQQNQQSQRQAELRRLASLGERELTEFPPHISRQQQQQQRAVTVGALPVSSSTSTSSMENVTRTMSLANLETNNNRSPAPTTARIPPSTSSASLTSSNTPAAAITTPLTASTIRSQAASHHPPNAYYEGQRLMAAAATMSNHNNNQFNYNFNRDSPELGRPGHTTNNSNTTAYGGGGGATMTNHHGWSTVDVSHEATAPPCARSLHSAAILNDQLLLIFGGYNGHARVNDFHSYNFSTRRWSPILASANSGRPPTPRDRHVSFVYGNTFYVMGGFDGTSRVNDFLGFDFSSMTWFHVQPRTGRPPTERHSHAAVVYRHAAYIYGGYDGSYKSDLHAYDFRLGSWSLVPASGRKPRARYRSTAVVHQSSLILFGGHDGTRHLNDAHVFCFQNQHWSELVAEGTPPIPRDSHVSVIWNQSMYIFGGSSGSAMNDLHELQLGTSTTSSSTSGGGGGSPTAGGNGTGAIINPKWRLVQTATASPHQQSLQQSTSALTTTTTTTSAGGAASSAIEPQPRHLFCHVAVVHQDSLYSFGGYDGSERLNDFYRFDFAAYDLTLQVPPSTLVPDLRSLVNDDTMSDITFLVEDRPVYAHKIILTLRSSYFRALFCGDMRESRLETIRMDQVSHTIFLDVLEYLYTDELHHIEFHSAMELFEAADLFCLSRLKQMCERCMLESMTIDNASDIFFKADVHSAKALRSKAIKYILAHFEQVSKTAAFEEMGRHNMELVFEILRNR